MVVVVMGMMMMMMITYCYVYGMNIDMFWIDGWIYYTLW
jgi:hypothetical protein